MNFKINGLLHSSVLVSNINDALAFYVAILGFEVSDRRPDLGYPGAWLDLGAQQFHLMELPNLDSHQGRPAHGGRDRHTAFAVNDITALAQRLALAKVSYTLSKSGRAALFCRDPDGNALEFVEATFS